LCLNEGVKRAVVYGKGALFLDGTAAAAGLTLRSRA